MGDQLTMSGVQLPVPENLSQYITSHPGQLSLAIPPWVGATSTSQRAVMSCSCGVKAGMVHECRAGKTVRSPCYHGPYLSALVMCSSNNRVFPITRVKKHISFTGWFCVQLAEVLDRARPDYSIVIWDVHAAASSDVPVQPERKASTAAVDSSFYASRAATELCRRSSATFLAQLAELSI